MEWSNTSEIKVNPNWLWNSFQEEHIVHSEQEQHLELLFFDIWLMFIILWHLNNGNNTELDVLYYLPLC